MNFQLDYRYWDNRKNNWRYDRKEFLTEEDAEEFIDQKGVDFFDKYEIKKTPA